MICGNAFLLCGKIALLFKPVRERFESAQGVSRAEIGLIGVCFFGSRGAGCEFSQKCFFKTLDGDEGSPTDSIFPRAREKAGAAAGREDLRRGNAVFFQLLQDSCEKRVNHSGESDCAAEAHCRNCGFSDGFRVFR